MGGRGAAATDRLLHDGRDGEGARLRAGDGGRGHRHDGDIPARVLRAKRAVAAEDWKAGGAALSQIRVLVGINLLLGLANLAVALLGPALG
jgi:hypothetical protein